MAFCQLRCNCHRSCHGIVCSLLLCVRAADQWLGVGLRQFIGNGPDGVARENHAAGKHPDGGVRVRDTSVSLAQAVRVPAGWRDSQQGRDADCCSASA